MAEHTYTLNVTWTGNLGEGTLTYRSYSRNHTIVVPGKTPLLGSADPAFRGDPARFNPEELLVGSLSTCHMLWYLHLCADAGVVVLSYDDVPLGKLQETATGGYFSQIILRPTVVISSDSDPGMAQALHHDAHNACFIANSVNFPVLCESSIQLASPATE